MLRLFLLLPQFNHRRFIIWVVVNILKIERNTLIMSIAKKLTSLSLLAGVAALLASFSVPASAQSPMGGWTKLCDEQKDEQGANVSICNTMNTVISSTGQPLTKVNLVEIKQGNKSEKRIGVEVPTGRFLPDGVKIKIDNDPEKIIPYTICNGPTCMASDVLTDDILAQLKKAKSLTVTSVNLQGSPNPLKVSLSDFTKVFDGPGMREQDLKVEQEKLQKALQKKQQEENDKLRAAQEKAKNSN